ncbi:MAG: L,D-transpeptidase family protein [Clostridiaceae bacterium]|nr:L,D-transpeptidase family protein [Clostridiaceae bacterium]
MKDKINRIRIKQILLTSFLVAVLLITAGCSDRKTQAGINDKPVFSSDAMENDKPATEQTNPGSETKENFSEPALTSDETTGTTSENLQNRNADSDKEQAVSVKEEEKEPLEIQGLVLVKDIIPDIEIELKYATEDNFTKTKVYPHDICVLQKSTAMKLKKANEELMEMGYKLKIWDAYRPLSVQKIFWDLVPDSRYVANPYAGGSKHNKGTAVDVTLADMDGNELEMPAEFDDFTGKAARNNKNISETARRNVELLTNVMVKNGFTTITTEWWHYNDSDSDKYSVLDVDLEEFMQGDAPVDDQSIKIDPIIDKLNNLDGINDTRQILLVLADNPETSKAAAYTYEKVNSQWQTVFEPFDCVTGRNGMTYDKREGDKKSPIGIFPLYRCFGRDENPGTRLLYTRFEENDFWVDDPDSSLYNTYQKGLPERRWASAEDLYGIGDIYRYFIVIEYNTHNPVPGKGSAIFMHIWRGKESYTSGCTAMAEENLLKIINWLEPLKNPLLIQYPIKDFLKINNL